VARLEQLVEGVQDDKLRRLIEAEITALKERTRFGLVYERHLPEMALIADPDLVQIGALVRPKKDVDKDVNYRVIGFNGKTARLTVDGNGKELEIPISELFVVKPFGEAIYPSLTPVDAVERSAERPYHAVINGENFHALQLLAYTYEGLVDCIYIDPPYNTGARDWKYNNRYVDNNDTYQHSKWLSMMEKRLRIAKRLLKPDSVLVCTIDEHEVSHLGLLLEELFPTARRQLVTIVNNAAGVSQGGLWRVEEYAYFCWFGNSRPNAIDDDLLADESKKKKTVIWFSLVRAGGVNATPAKRPNLVFPIAIDPTTNRIAGIGRTLKERRDAGEVSGDLNAWRPDPNETVNGLPVVWPFNPDGSLYTWQMNPEGVMATEAEGFVRVRVYDGAVGNRWSISYVRSGHQKKIKSGEFPTLGREDGGGAYILGDVEKSVVPKTVWKRARHDAGKWGSRTLRELLGDVSFDYAKSPYAVLDTLRVAVADRPDALILDFFAGSGTTLHSTCMLNAEDGGHRRCVLVTNNDVAPERTKLLKKDGFSRGDSEFERHGIFEAVALPRCKAAITGRSSAGQPLEGSLESGRPHSAGFDENVAFFRLDYMNADTVELGEAFDAIHSLLWLAAGGRGARPEMLDAASKEFFVSERGGYAVLFAHVALRDLEEEIAGRHDITHLYVITDSPDAYAEAVEVLGQSRNTSMLYRDYLRNFRINTPQNV
jgi:adenine-specific DNA-methyltransferase